MADIINQEAAVQPARITAGDDFAFTLLIKKDGVAENLTGWSIEAQVKDKSDGTLIATLSIGSGITLAVQSGSTLGQALVVIEQSITEELRTRKCLVLDIQTVNTDGLKRTYLKMHITASVDITQT